MMASTSRYNAAPKYNAKYYYSTPKQLDYITDNTASRQTHSHDQEPTPTTTFTNIIALIIFTTPVLIYCYHTRSRFPSPHETFEQQVIFPMLTDIPLRNFPPDSTLPLCHSAHGLCLLNYH
jgi:hypothetical protein